MTATNDEDSDQLVNTIVIGPSDIVVDTTASRTVCNEFAPPAIPAPIPSCTAAPPTPVLCSIAYKGKSNHDGYGDVRLQIPGVGFAIEMDAWRFASQH
jgi:hypothetical protein